MRLACYGSDLQRALARLQTELRLQVHMLHVLCLLARLRIDNRVASQATLQATAVSLLPRSLAMATLSKTSLVALAVWVQSAWSLVPSAPADAAPSDRPVGAASAIHAHTEHLRRCCGHKQSTPDELALIAIALLRGLGYPCRLVSAFMPLSKAVPPEDRIHCPSSSARGRGRGAGRQPAVGRRRQSSARGEATAQPAALCLDRWAEVLVPGRGSADWIPICLVRGLVGKPEGMEAGCSGPLSSVIGMDAMSHALDVTPRYSSSWLTATRKRRADPDWVAAALRFFLPPTKEVTAGFPPPRASAPALLTVYCGALVFVLPRFAFALCTRKGREHRKQEEAQLAKRHLSEALPRAVGAYKDHPLYILERFLKRDEVLHPRGKWSALERLSPGAQTQGHIWSQCVHGGRRTCPGAVPRRTCLSTQPSPKGALKGTVVPEGQDRAGRGSTCKNGYRMAPTDCRRSHLLTLRHCCSQSAGARHAGKPRDAPVRGMAS
jgi:hypothetical protein